MKTITGMNSAADVALPSRCDAGGVCVDTVEIAGLSTEDLLDHLNAIEQAEAVLTELLAAVLHEMARRWGTGRVQGA